MCLWEVRGKRKEKKGRNKGARDELKYFRVVNMTRDLIYWLLIGCREEKEGKIGWERHSYSRNTEDWRGSITNYFDTPLK